MSTAALPVQRHARGCVAASPRVHAPHVKGRATDIQQSDPRCRVSAKGIWRGPTTSPQHSQTVTYPFLCAHSTSHEAHDSAATPAANMTAAGCECAQAHLPPQNLCRRHELTRCHHAHVRQRAAARAAPPMSPNTSSANARNRQSCARRLGLRATNNSQDKGRPTTTRKQHLGSKRERGTNGCVADQTAST